MWLCLVETWRQSGDQVPFMLTTYGTCEDGTGGPNNAGGGGGGSAPTGVSIGSTSSGNFNNAVAAEETAVGFGAMDIAASGFSSGGASKQVDTSGMNSAFFGVSGQATIKVYGFIRATGATSFQWDLQTGPETSLSAGTASVQGTASTSQDATSSGIGEQGVITWGGGRGGLIFPSNGDVLEFVVAASATNSSGTTNASAVTFRHEFTS